MAHPAITPEMRRWVETWKQAGPELAAIRREEIRATETVTGLAQLTDAYQHASTLPPRETSGMVEMQRLFSKLWSR